jgi:hypothetical protein
MVKDVRGNQRGLGMTRSIVDQKLSALLSAEARLHRALERSLECGALADAYRKAEDEYNEAFDAWWHSPPGGVVPEPSEENFEDVA